MDDFIITVEGRGEDTQDQCTVDGHGAEGVELEERDEVVRTQGEDNV